MTCQECNCELGPGSDGLDYDMCEDCFAEFESQDLEDQLDQAFGMVDPL